MRSAAPTGHAAGVRSYVPFFVLFCAAFGFALAWSIRNRPEVPAAQAVEARSPRPSALVPDDAAVVSASPAVAAASAGASGAAQAAVDIASASQPAPTMPEPERRALLQAALVADESEDRRAALSQLARQPVADSLPMIEQVLRSDEDLRNRMAAIRLLAEAPDRKELAGPILRMLRDFTSDADEHVARLAREAYDALQAGAPVSGGAHAVASAGVVRPSR